MRAVFGIGGILATLGVIVWIMSFELGHDKAVIDAGNKATVEVDQMAGRDENGTPVKDSATLEPQTTNGKTDSVLVTSVAADGPYAKMWGLKRDDAIVEIGPLPVSQVATDAGSAADYVMDAYQKGEPLTIYRDGKQMVLQAQSALTPAAGPNRSGSPLQNQLDAIQRQQIPTH
jgi:hypothetical protein